MRVDTSALRSAIMADAITELRREGTFDVDILRVKTDNAIRAVMLKRNYPNSMSDVNVINDLERHWSLIVELAITKYDMVGMNGQTSHAENGVTRNWRTEDEILGDVFAYVGCV